MMLLSALIAFCPDKTCFPWPCPPLQADRLRLRVAAATLSVGRQDRPRLPPELVQRILALALLDLSWR